MSTPRKIFVLVISLLCIAAGLAVWRACTVEKPVILKGEIQLSINDRTVDVRIVYWRDPVRIANPAHMGPVIGGGTHYKTSIKFDSQQSVVVETDTEPWSLDYVDGRFMLSCNFGPEWEFYEIDSARRMTKLKNADIRSENLQWNLLPPGDREDAGVSFQLFRMNQMFLKKELNAN